MVKTIGETQYIYLIIMAYIGYLGWKPYPEEMQKERSIII